jgi:choline dehydrogenase-like flavoprotein
MATNEKVDVVVAGAGSSGSVYAAVLARQGKSVVVLEQGPDWQVTDLISSDIWGRRVKPAGGPFILEGKHPVSYGYQAGWGVGGTALHYFANFPRLLPNDFKIKSDHNRAHYWPISYQDVAPYYDKVALDVGVSGDAKAEEIWRSAGEPCPMPPMKTFQRTIEFKAKRILAGQGRLRGAKLRRRLGQAADFRRPLEVPQQAKIQGQRHASSR